METILDVCCGLDVHKESVVACIIKTKTSLNRDQNDNFEKEIRTFKTFEKDIIDLKNWIELHGSKYVAMESTGVYWVPIYNILETAFEGKIELLVTNARHMKNVPGKKTDIKDAEWIATLLRAGLLRGSFIPPHEIRELRLFTRYRKNIVQDISAQKNRIEKLLQQVRVKLSTFLSDVFGVAGRKLIDILIKNGKITPLDVEEEIKKISKTKKEEIKYSITGNLNNQERKFLSMQINHLDELYNHVKTIEESIAKISDKYEHQINNLDTIPGIAVTAATAIIAEVGIDMNRFPTVEHFCSWAGITPGNNESTGKKKYTSHLWK